MGDEKVSTRATINEARHNCGQGKRKSKAVAGHGRTHQTKMDVSALLSPSVAYTPELMPITMMIVYSALIALIESSVAQLNHLHVSTTNRHGVS